MKDQIEDLFGNYFSEIIKKRGYDYYLNKNVKSVLNYKNKYFAKVKGSNGNEYDVTITYTCEDVEMSCSCPCEFNCKHEFATLIAIYSHEYKKVYLKPYIKKKRESIKTTITKIPPEELKTFLLKQNLYLNPFERNNFEQYFSKYLPNQSYYYYYNNLYNDLLLKKNYMKKIYNYLNEINIKINNYNFDQSFIIIKAIINALNDTNNLNSYNIIKTYPLLKMLLKITYNKASNKLKKEINMWITNLKNNKHYNNLTLKEIVEDIK